MVFDPQTWADGELITAEDLNRVEQAVDAVDEQMGSKVDANDPRLSDARPPTAHQHPVSDVTGLATRLAAIELGRGWRNISELFDSALVSSGEVLIRWNGTGRLDYQFKGFAMTNTGGIVLAWGSLPPGYRPASNQVGSIIPLNGKGAPAEVTFNLGGGIVISGATAGVRFNGNCSVFTDGAVPSLDPGTPA